MSDNGLLPCYLGVETKVEVKEEPLEEDDNEMNDGMSLEHCSDDNQHVEYDAPKVENVAYGAMQNEEVLPDSFPVPIGYPVNIKEEDKSEEPSITSQMPETVPSDVSPIKASPGDIAEKQKHLPSTSESGVSISDVSKLLHKKRKLALKESIPKDEDELQFPNVKQGLNFNILATAPSPPCLLSPEPSTIADSFPSSTTPVLSTYAESPTSLLISTQRCVTSQGSSATNLQSATLFLSSPPSSSAAAVTAAAEVVQDDPQDSNEIMRTERKKAKRNCPTEALNVVQEILLNPSSCHVYHLHNLATFMTERMRSMGTRKRKRVENRLLQLILEEDM